MRAPKDIAAALCQYAYDNGRDHITVWDEFLQHCVDTLSFTNEELREGKWFERIERYNAINPTYSEIFRELVGKVAAKIKVSDKSGTIPDLSTTVRKRAAGLIKDKANLI